MFLKMDSFFLKSNTTATIKLYNGTFDKSENAIAKYRMADVSILGNGNLQHPDTTQWMDIEKFTVLNFKTGEAGTYVAGVSSKSNSIKMSAKDFNEYLKHDGVLDMLEWRTQNKAMDKPAVEKHSKHVKAIFQVDDKKTDDWKTPLGYPIEFIPLSNPYDLAVGQTLQVKLLKNGQPLVNQLVYAGVAEKEHAHAGGKAHSHDKEAEHAHADDKAHSHDKGKEKAKAHSHGDHKAHSHEAEAKETEAEHRHDENQLTTNAEGILTLKADHEGFWFLRTINMVLSNETGFTHESNWATLTFEVANKKVETVATTVENAGSAKPNYLLWGALAGVLLLGVLWYFKIKKA